MRFWAAFVILGAIQPSMSFGACWDVLKAFPHSATKEQMRAGAGAAGKHFGLPFWILPAVVDVENGPWDPTSVDTTGVSSGKTLVGSVGLGMVVPETVLMLRRERPVKERVFQVAEMLRKDWRVNLCWSARILRRSLILAGWRDGEDLTPSDPRLWCALAAYNAGDGVCRYVRKVVSAIQ